MNVSLQGRQWDAQVWAAESLRLQEMEGTRAGANLQPWEPFDEFL